MIDVDAFDAFEVAVFDIFYDKLIKRKDIKTLWSLTHHDGPRSGLIEYKGSVYYTDTIFDEFLAERVFAVYKIPNEKIKKTLDYCEARYKVAGNCKYHSNGEKDNLDIDHSTVEFEKAINEFRKTHSLPSYYPGTGDKIIGFFRGWRYYDDYE